MKIVIFLLIMIPVLAKGQDKVIYKQKQYEKFDLGDMERKGSLVAPGDLSVKERRRRIFKRKLFQRADFNKEIINDIKYLR